MDGHWEQRNSQLSMHRFSASQHPKCTIKIKVLESTTSGEHKVKVQVCALSQLPSLQAQLEQKHFW